jgi:hypothetical protein
MHAEVASRIRWLLTAAEFLMRNLTPLDSLSLMTLANLMAFFSLVARPQTAAATSRGSLPDSVVFCAGGCAILLLWTVCAIVLRLFGLA